MVISLDQQPLTQTLIPRSRLRRSLVRHVSAPASPRLTLESSDRSEGRLHTSKQRSLLSPVSPRSKHSLLRELSSAQSLAGRLRRDRDEWKSLAQKEEQDLVAAERVVKEQAQTISNLEDGHAKLQNLEQVHTSMGDQVDSRLQELATKHDNLVDQLNDALRTITRLRKSDRSKGKVQQRNLRLKATLQRYTSQATLSMGADEDAEATLREALALANERIEELETKGVGLLEALEKRNDSSGSDDEGEMEEEDKGAALLEAEVIFRGVLEDGSYREQKENWADLLHE